MTSFQLLLLIISAIVFYIFYKQLISGDYPKRGVDFNAKLPDENIGGISRVDKIFKEVPKQKSRIDSLLEIADSAIEKEDLQEAKKALQSILILDSKNLDAIHRLGYISLREEDFQEAMQRYKEAIEIDTDDDLAYDALANILHKLKSEEEAIEHHKKAIKLDGEYAAYHFNYANTLYDLKKYKEAKSEYETAYALDSSISEAKKMIEKLEQKDL